MSCTQPNCPNACALVELERLGDLRGYVQHAVLLPGIKSLLAAIPPVQRRDYFTFDSRGQKLLAELCHGGNINEVRYAVQKLKLLRYCVPSNSEEPNPADLCPLVAALYAYRPSVQVVRYLTEQGWPVPPAAFVLWSALPADKKHLRMLLKPLVKFGRCAIPRTSKLLERMTLVFDPYYRRRSEHLDAARGLIPFTAYDARLAAISGLISIAEQIIENYGLTDGDDLADVYEMCELSSYSYAKDDLSELPYFRQALRYKRLADSPRLCYGHRTLFKSDEDIDRLEQQMAAGNYIEVTWQLLLVAAEVGLPVIRIDGRFLRRVHDLGAIAEMKHFVLNSGYFQDSLSSQVESIFLMHVQYHCIRVVRDCAAAWPSLFSDLYRCLKDVFSSEGPEQRSLAHAIRQALTTIDAEQLAHESALSKQQLDETLLVVVYGADLNELPNVEPYIAALLAAGASVFTLEGHTVSTFALLLNKFHIVPESFRHLLARRLCCALDVAPSSLHRLGVASSVIKTPRSLRCLAAMACPRLPRAVLQEELPASLVFPAFAHPRVVNADKDQ